MVAEDVCRALAAVHANGLIHRDVKARNIIREHDGRDRADGLRRRAVAASERRTRRPRSGRRSTCAPETFDGRAGDSGQRRLQRRRAAVLPRDGRYPYEGQTVDDIRDAHASGRANRLLQLRPDLPVRFAKVVDRALSIDPADRYQTPAEVQNALVAARTLTLTWPQRLYRLALFVVFILVLMLVGGMISSAAFNSRFGRAQYASESLGDWFELGCRSLLMPVVLSLIGTLLVGGALAFRNIAVKTSGALRSLDRRLRQGCIVLAERLSLRDATVCASWLVMLTALGLLGIWLNFRQLLHTLSIDWITVPAQSLSILTPAYLEHRTHYRMALGLLAAANVTGWYALRRATAGGRPGCRCGSSGWNLPCSSFYSDRCSCRTGFSTTTGSSRPRPGRATDVSSSESGPRTPCSSALKSRRAFASARRRRGPWS